MKKAAYAKLYLSDNPANPALQEEIENNLVNQYKPEVRVLLHYLRDNPAVEIEDIVDRMEWLLRNYRAGLRLEEGPLNEEIALVFRKAGDYLNIYKQAVLEATGEFSPQDFYEVHDFQEFMDIDCGYAIEEDIPEKEEWFRTKAEAQAERAKTLPQEVKVEDITVQTIEARTGIFILQIRHNEIVDWIHKKGWVLGNDGLPRTEQEQYYYQYLISQLRTRKGSDGRSYDSRFAMGVKEKLDDASHKLYVVLALTKWEEAEPGDYIFQYAIGRYVREALYLTHPVTKEVFCFEHEPALLYGMFPVFNVEFCRRTDGWVRPPDDLGLVVSGPTRPGETLASVTFGPHLPPDYLGVAESSSSKEGSIGRFNLGSGI